MKASEFIQMSLELNLFFLRIIKEHMIFMEISFPIKNSNLILEADNLKTSFEELLRETVELSRGNISKEAIESNEIVTKYTLNAETKIENIFGACIDKNITKDELELTSIETSTPSYNLEDKVYNLNNRIINLLMDVIKFKEKVLDEVLECDVFISIYPEMLEHLLREAKFYLKMLLDLQEDMTTKKDILEKEIFWNHIMEEHALFVRGMLDPSEEELIKKANNFAELFEKLLKKTKEADKKDTCSITEKNLDATKDISKFKANATEGMLKCQIKGIANPLLADHILREANRYIRILKEYIKEYCK